MRGAQGHVGVTVKGEEIFFFKLFKLLIIVLYLCREIQTGKLCSMDLIAGRKHL